MKAVVACKIASSSKFCTIQQNQSDRCEDRVCVNRFTFGITVNVRLASVSITYKFSQNNDLENGIKVL